MVQIVFLDERQLRTPLCTRSTEAIKQQKKRMPIRLKGSRQKYDKEENNHIPPLPRNVTHKCGTK